MASGPNMWVRLTTPAELRPEDLHDPKAVVQAGLPPGRIDVIMSPERVQRVPDNNRVRVGEGEGGREMTGGRCTCRYYQADTHSSPITEY
jgi:non-ribosomal peptide synthetase component E (peptide arylation enzyme)